MNNKLLLITIIIIVLIIIVITVIIVNNCKQKIEKFKNITYMNYPRIVLPNSNDTFEISIINYKTPEQSVNTLYEMNLVEKYSIVANIASDNLGINGYGTYYINTTYYIDTPTSTNCISALFNDLITLKSPS